MSGIFESFNLYSHAEKFYLEPTELGGGASSTTYLEIDRHTSSMRVNDSRAQRIPIIDSDIKFIYGVLGTIKLVAGNALIVITKAKIVGQIGNHNIWTILDTEIIPFKKTTLHLTERQARYNRRFIEMLGSVLNFGGFFYSTTFDISRTQQFLQQNQGSAAFQTSSMMDRASDRFIWNGYLLTQIRSVSGAEKFTLPIIHGFFGQTKLQINGSSIKLTIISRRSIYRAGVRFYKRGVDNDGHAANFVETEQILEFDAEEKHTTSFVQLRGSIPLLWSQKPNLRWQPTPQMRPTDDQLAAFNRSFAWHQKHYGGKHVIVNLVNQKGREKKIGGELERIAQQANIDFVRYHQFDFHKECHAMQWNRLSILKDQLADEIQAFGFFYSCPSQVQPTRYQQGFFRTNCMDCLDRTNVVQSMLARESLTDQLRMFGILGQHQSVENVDQLEIVFKHLWADNGDECSRQYAGTGALKSDFTRLGKRTYLGAMNDGVNAVSRYMRNNFGDGYRQDSIDLFLGNFVINTSDLPPTLETSIFSTDQNGLALVAALFAMSMTILCMLVADNFTATIFWLIIFFVCVSFIFLNGEEFVNTPKLKID
ncbi:unnamed protein product [Caenorhabditis angaria]|uniref:Phosphatidylinositol-3-phosphatase SAC1 n=1 Tax=Caenorhabditis angaria TaxID=860376 RepID=A0A9P1I7S7_9PELO|nr:unnamed protein product [Caenorhabditis angaria]